MESYECIWINFVFWVKVCTGGIIHYHGYKWKQAVAGRVSTFGRMEWWNGIVEWNSEMDYWNGGMLHRTYLIIQHVLYSEQWALRCVLCMHCWLDGWLDRLVLHCMNFELWSRPWYTFSPCPTLSAGTEPKPHRHCRKWHHKLKVVWRIYASIVCNRLK